MKSVALHNLGCKVNGYEIEVMQQILQEKGYKIVPFDQKADIYIINTCTVTNIADRKSRQMRHRAKKQNPNAVVVAAGCYVEIGAEQVKADPAVDLAIGNNRKKDIAEILEAYLAGRESTEDKSALACSGHEWDPDGTMAIPMDDGQHNMYEEMHLRGTTEHTRAYIKIQDGCNQFCTYCIIPYARGRVRSRKEEDILLEVKNLALLGCSEIVLTGIHISSYGLDRGGRELKELLKKLNEIRGIKRIRLGSLEPGIITEQFIRELSNLEKLCPHFHLSLQSGCDETLRRMNRHYTTGEYSEKVKLIRQFFENPAVTTDVIVGFPGETEEEFIQTESFLGEIGFYEMHVFKYSKRQGTKAAVMPGQVPETIKNERSARLIALNEEMELSYKKEWLGKNVEVLFEEQIESNGNLLWVGHTKEYLKVAAETGENLQGKIRMGTITGFFPGDFPYLSLNFADR